MFTKYTLPLCPIYTSPLVLFGWYACDLYLFIYFCLFSQKFIKSGVPLLFYFHVSREYGGYLTLHESPRNV
uniref:Uncharacterized protein n=1 Tax=Anguilla anguilla TaxID=7936 RepID=A0A0E9XCZ6_ANGAN